MVGNAAPEHVAQATTDALSQLNPQDYQNHFQQNQPIGNLAPQQQSGLAQTLISALLNRGVNRNQLQQNAGVSTLNPSQMSPQEIASLLQYAQQNHPQALGQVASQYQNQPDILHSILGNQAIMSIATNLAENYIAGKL